MENLIKRITIDSGICHGKPTIRGLRYPVENMLELLASGMSINEISVEQERIVISKDIDFPESFLIKSEPLKLILIKTGNITNIHLLEIFSTKLDMIIKMIKRSNLVEISKIDIAEQE